jgi:hypothetical protein
MLRSRNKYTRAVLRAKSRRPQRRNSSSWFVVAVSVVCLAGVLGVLFLGGLVTDGDEASAGAPSPPSASNPAGDHWHAAFAVNVCGEWLGFPPEFETAADNANIRPGIHTHGDGFVHIHPFTSSESGDNATLGKFFEYGGWSVSDSSFEVWSGPSAQAAKTEWSNGDRCPSASGQPGEGKPGRLVFEVNCKAVSGNPADHKLADQEVVAIGFLPKGTKLGAPPNAASAPSDDGGGSTAIDQAGCRPSSVNNPGVTATTTSTPAATTSTTQQ